MGEKQEEKQRGETKYIGRGGLTEGRKEWKIEGEMQIRETEGTRKKGRERGKRDRGERQKTKDRMEATEREVEGRNRK